MKTNKEYRRQEILDCARRVFSRHGFEKATMDDIARSVGLKKGSLYYYYESKDALVSDVISREGEKLVTSIKDEVGKVDDIRGKILKFVSVRLDFFGNLYGILKPTVRIILAMRPTYYQYSRDIFEKEVDMLAGLINQGIRSGIFNECNCRHIAGVILNICDAVELRMYQQSYTGEASDINYVQIDKEVNLAVRLMLDGLSR